MSLRTPTELHCEPGWLFRRNVSAVTVLCLGVATAGIMTVVSLVMIGMVVSSALLRLSSIGVPTVVLLAGTLPHGIFEIGGFIWAGGAGLSGVRIALAMFSKDSSGGIEIRPELVRAGRAYVIAAVCVAIGALVECYVTPIVFGYVVKHAAASYQDAAAHVC